VAVATNGTEFAIDVQVSGGQEADATAGAVDRLATGLTAAEAAVASTSSALSAAEQAYKQSEGAADRMAKALEKVSSAAEVQRGKLEAAMNAGDDSGAARAAASLRKLSERQTEVAQKATAAKAALAAEAAAVDLLRAESGDAATAQAALAKQLDKAKTAASDAAKAQQAAAGTGNLGKLSGALNQLGGPLGRVGGTATGAADAISDLTETVGKAGPYVALAVAAVALSTAMIGGAAAATVWLVKMGGGMKRVGEIGTKFDKFVEGLFQGPKLQSALTKLLDGLDQLAALFDANSVTGRAMQTLIEDLGGNLLNFVSTLIPKVIAGFIQFEIWIYKALIAIKPYGSTIMTVAGAIAAFAAVVAGVFVGAIALAIGIVSLFIALPTLLGKAFAWAGEQIMGFGKTITDYLGSLSLESMGTSLIEGLVKGITGGAASVISAMTGVVGGAIDAAKGALGIASPSKVFAEIGTNTAEGMSEGVETGAGQVQTSLESMVSPPATEGATASASGGSGGGANFSGAQFIFNGVAGAEDAIARFEEIVLRLIEGDVTQSGGEAPAGA
jgi:hypothetical protein